MARNEFPQSEYENRNPAPGSYPATTLTPEQPQIGRVADEPGLKRSVEQTLRDKGVSKN